MFGYDLKPIEDGRTIQLANPEKAILDLLYIYPFYNTSEEMIELRFDDDFLHNDFDVSKMQEQAQLFKNKALDKRVKLFKNAYSL
jgi:hypothetical protein